MAGKTYVTKGYSTHTNIPAPQHGYDHGSKNHGNQYAVQTKTTKQWLAAGYTDFVGSPSKAELLKEYVHAPSMSKTPKYDETLAPGFEPSYGLNYENSSPPKYHGQQAFKKAPNQPSSNKPWQSAGPPGTLHPLTTPTNNINEALGFLEESVYYSPRADPRRRGVLDDLSTRAQPIEPQRRYARPAFVPKAKDGLYNFSNTGSSINSHEATRRYRGALMP